MNVKKKSPQRKTQFIAEHPLTGWLLSLFLLSYPLHILHIFSYCVLAS